MLADWGDVPAAPCAVAAGGAARRFQAVGAVRDERLDLDGVARGDAQHRRRRGAVVAVGDGARRGGEPMEVLGGERRGCGAEQEESDERSVHAGTYAGTRGTATNVHFVRRRTITMRIEIATREGLAPSYVFRPEGPGKGLWPAVLVFMDGIGIRPAMLEVGERLATHGDFVLLPDLYYRSGPYAPMNAKTVFADPEQRKVLMERFMSKATLPALMSDTH